MSGAVHIPVLRDEVVGALNIADGKTFLDGTFGAGGYTTAILEAADCRVVAIDRDPDAIRRGAALKERFGDRLMLLEGRFGDMDTLVREAGIETVDGIALDIGVSSPQIDEAERGFSFQKDGPLDMRMAGAGPGSGASAADVVNTLKHGDLALQEFIKRPVNVAPLPQLPLQVDVAAAELVLLFIGPSQDFSQDFVILQEVRVGGRAVLVVQRL